jgi:hypothetical protein
MIPTYLIGSEECECRGHVRIFDCWAQIRFGRGADKIMKELVGCRALGQPTTGVATAGHNEVVTVEQKSTEERLQTGEAASEPLGLYDGFEAYRSPTEDDYRNLLTGGLVVPDTNVLLDLYRYNTLTRNDLLSVLGKLGDNLWVPHQVLLEFWSKREGVLQDPRDTDKTRTELSKLSSRGQATIREWAKRVRLPEQRRDELTETLSKAFSAVVEGVAELATDDGREFARDTAKDPVLAGLEPILRGHCGAALNEQDRAAAVKEAQERGKTRRPPGWKDMGLEGKGSAGDYLIWVQVLREALSRQRDVLLVTSDVKEDWWRKENGELRGPLPELAEEMRQVARVRLFMLRPDSLLIHARQVMHWEVRNESVEDIERVASEQASINLTKQPLRPVAASPELQPTEDYESIEVYVGKEPAVPVGFIGQWLVEPDEDETRTGEEGYDAGAYWGVALTQRGKIAVYTAHVNDGWPASLDVFDSLDDAESNGVPQDILAKAAIELGEERVVWRDI